MSITACRWPFAYQCSVVTCIDGYVTADTTPMTGPGFPLPDLDPMSGKFGFRFLESKTSPAISVPGVSSCQIQHVLPCQARVGMGSLCTMEGKPQLHDFL
jgi:hypothetical protein